MHTELTALLSSSEWQFRLLPKNCRATFVLENQSDLSGVQVKVFTEPKSSMWHFNRNAFHGMLIVWAHSFVMVGESHSFSSLKSIRTRSLKEKMNGFLIEKDLLRAKLLSYACHLAPDILTAAMSNLTQDPQLYELRPTDSNKQLEHTANCELSVILNDKLEFTREGCTADATFQHRARAHLGLQLKAATKHKQGFYNFKHTFGYDALLLLCRPFPNEGIGTLVMAGASVKVESIGMRTGPNTMYAKYIVKDTDLLNFLENVAAAVADGRTTFEWPEVANVDISKLRLADMPAWQTASSPEFATEHYHHQWRLQKYPSFEYDNVAIQGTTVDVLIFNKKIQDKSSHLQRSSQSVAAGLQVVMFKEEHNRPVPYHKSDFDYLWVFTPGMKYFFFIPMEELVTHNVVRSADSSGRINFRVFLPCSSPRRQSQDLWTEKFCYDSENPRVESMLRVALSGHP